MKVTLLASMLGLWLLSPLATANSLCPSPLLVGWDDWPPYHYKAPDGTLKGFLITIETQPASTGVVALEPYDSRS